MARRKRADSVDYQTEVRERLRTGIEPPIKLLRKEKDIFNRIISELPLDAWEEHRLEMAANLARLIGQAEGLQLEVMEEGVVFNHPSRGEMLSPKFTALQQLYSTIGKLMRLLGVAASQRGISDDSLQRRRQAEKDAKAAIAGAKKGLLA